LLQAANGVTVSRVGAMANSHPRQSTPSSILCQSALLVCNFWSDPAY
jgi:hypothetical protein